VKRSEALRADGESPQQAFSKVITDDETGRLLYQAMKRAPGAEVKKRKAPMSSAFAQAIERHRAAQAAIDAADGPEGYPDHPRDENSTPSTSLPRLLARAMQNLSRNCVICTLTKHEYLGRRPVNMNSFQSFSRPIVTSSR
jgi:hypothetical protein